MSKDIFRIQFRHGEQLYTLHAGHVASSSVWGFVEISDLRFDPPSPLLVDPAEERLRDEFADTRELHVPMHNVLRIERVVRKGTSAVRDAGNGGNVVTPFPMPAKPGS